jgi:DNA polymerase III subunit epsilon
MDTFTAIDFETAQGYRWSICQVGLIRVENGAIAHEINLLVQPPGNYYWDKFIGVHGIRPRDTANAPTFDKIWHKIQPLITNQTVVAHNGLAFDFPVLAQTLNLYDIAVPEYQKKCTYKIYRKGLAKLCNENNLSLTHHDALSDARACAELYLKFLESKNKLKTC